MQKRNKEAQEKFDNFKTDVNMIFGQEAPEIMNYLQSKPWFEASLEMPKINSIHKYQLQATDKQLLKIRGSLWRKLGK